MKALMVGTTSTSSVASPGKVGRRGSRPHLTGGNFSLFLLLLASFSFSTHAFAHRLDEYLQATLVSIEPSTIRLQINLTPGIAVADQILSHIDRNRDGIISTNEFIAYAQLLNRDLTVQLDHHNIELTPGTWYCPTPEELRTGCGIIQLELHGKLKSLTAGTNFITIENRHEPALSVYLLNAAQPKSGTIQILAQNRNPTQAKGEIAFTFRPASNQTRGLGIAAVSGSLAGLLVLLRIGPLNR
jgi:hypothetical protein